MKIRNGFISNSSSSCFIVVISESILNKIFDDFNNTFVSQTIKQFIREKKLLKKYNENFITLEFFQGNLSDMNPEEKDITGYKEEDLEKLKNEERYLRLGFDPITYCIELFDQLLTEKYKGEFISHTVDC